MSNIETKTCAEAVLDGMSNLITKEQWQSLLDDRMDVNPGAKNEYLLSKEFILKYKNNMLLSQLPLYCMVAWDKQKLDVDFLKRFWRFISFPAGNEVLLEFSNFCQAGQGFAEAYSALVNPINPVKIAIGEADPFTMEQLDKRPFHYSKEHWNYSLNQMKDVSLEFVEKYINMIDFLPLLNNANLSEEKRIEIRDKFSVAFDKTTDDDDGSVRSYLFPCGALLQDTAWYTMNSGSLYLRNRNRFSVSDDYKDVLPKVVAKFPRAFEDCLSGGNEVVMQDK